MLDGCCRVIMKGPNNGKLGNMDNIKCALELFRRGYQRIGNAQLHVVRKYVARRILLVADIEAMDIEPEVRHAGTPRHIESPGTGRRSEPPGVTSDKKGRLDSRVSRTNIGNFELNHAIITGADRGSQISQDAWVDDASGHIFEQIVLEEKSTM